MQNGSVAPCLGLLGKEQAGGLGKQETRSPPQAKTSGGEKFLALLANKDQEASLVGFGGVFFFLLNLGI